MGVGRPCLAKLVVGGARKQLADIALSRWGLDSRNQVRIQRKGTGEKASTAGSDPQRCEHYLVESATQQWTARLL